MTPGTYSPIPKPLALAKGMQSGRYALTDLGLERRCSDCNETWPADTEFFWSSPSTGSGLHSWCKACYRARTQARRAAQAA